VNLVEPLVSLVSVALAFRFRSLSLARRMIELVRSWTPNSRLALDAPNALGCDWSIMPINATLSSTPDRKAALMTNVPIRFIPRE